MIIRPAKRIAGTIEVPGDKSISHRAAMIAAIADGDTAISNYATGNDCLSTLSVLRQLGVGIEILGDKIVVIGVGKSGLRQGAEPLDCGNSGTTMRLLAGILAGQQFESVLIGDRSLNARPMERVAKPLRKMGAEVVTDDGHPPITIMGGDLSSIEYSMNVASAQVKSCVLLAGLHASGTTRITEPTPTRDHTETMLRHFGYPLRSNGTTIEIDGGRLLTANDVNVPGDPSSAAFFAAAAAMVPESEITIRNVLANPRRAAFFELLTEIGHSVSITPSDGSFVEPTGDISVSYGSPAADRVEISGQRTVDLIDELPLVAVLGTSLPAGLIVRDAAELRSKETDRIRAVVDGLRQMNATIEEFDDGFAVEYSPLTSGTVESRGDHRIAMAFAIAALRADGDTTVIDSECINVSFPGFFDSLKSVVM